MRNARFRSNAAALVARFSVSLLAGCATGQEQRSEGLSSQEFRILYPRKYFDALDPLERREVERRMREE